MVSRAFQVLVLGCRGQACSGVRINQKDLRVVGFGAES